MNDLEPLITDERLRGIAGALWDRFPNLPEQTLPVTYIDERPDGNWAVFSLISPNPKAEGFQVQTKGEWPLVAWAEKDRAFVHFVGIPDPAGVAFAQIAKRHAETMTNLRELN